MKSLLIITLLMFVTFCEQTTAQRLRPFPSCTQAQISNPPYQTCTDSINGVKVIIFNINIRSSK